MTVPRSLRLIAHRSCRNALGTGPNLLGRGEKPIADTPSSQPGFSTIVRLAADQSDVSLGQLESWFSLGACCRYKDQRGVLAMEIIQVGADSTPTSWKRQMESAE
jgi:hypothetical protein